MPLHDAIETSTQIIQFDQKYTIRCLANIYDLFTFRFISLFANVYVIYIPMKSCENIKK